MKVRPGLTSEGLGVTHAFGRARTHHELPANNPVPFQEVPEGKERTGKGWPQYTDFCLLMDRIHISPRQAELGRVDSCRCGLSHKKQKEDSVAEEWVNIILHFSSENEQTGLFLLLGYRQSLFPAFQGIPLLRIDAVV